MFVMLILASNLRDFKIIIDGHFELSFIYFSVVSSSPMSQILGKFQVVFDNIAICCIKSWLACSVVMWSVE
jgi:hypothetical protein